MSLTRGSQQSKQRADGCAEWGHHCPVHLLFHYRCDDCGVDCTIGTLDGPPTKESDGITRCYKCNHKVPRFWAVGKNALVAKASGDLLAALKEFMSMWGSRDACSTSKRSQQRRAKMWELAEAAIAKAEQGQ